MVSVPSPPPYTDNSSSFVHKYISSSHTSCRAHELSIIPTRAQVYTPPEAAYHAAYHGAYASPQGSVQP